MGPLAHTQNAIKTKDSHSDTYTRTLMLILTCLGLPGLKLTLQCWRSHSDSLGLIKDVPWDLDSYSNPYFHPELHTQTDIRQLR